LAAAGDEHTFELTWQEQGFHQSLDASLEGVEPFEKEPDFEGRDVLRGELRIGVPDYEELMGFVWSRIDGKLYVDLNRDGDLTNDPNGVLSAEDSHGGEDYYNHNFLTTFPVSVSTELGTYHYRLSAFLQSYGDYFKQARFYQESGYSGKTTLYEKQWLFQVSDKPGGFIEQGNEFSLSSIDNPNANSILSLSLPASLYLDGRCYDMGFEFKKSEHSSPSLWCTLREKNVSTGLFQIESKWVQRLAFGNGEILVLPEPLQGEAIVPTGRFLVKQCDLKYNPDKPVISPNRLHEINVTVLDGRENKFQIGAPLTNSVQIERVGKVLKLDYKLKGAGGEVYDAQRIHNYDSNKKPSVAIYKGDMQVATGQFEYG
jgi:hypothetical protein